MTTLYQTHGIQLGVNGCPKCSGYVTEDHEGDYLCSWCGLRKPSNPLRGLRFPHDEPGKRGRHNAQKENPMHSVVIELRLDGWSYNRIADYMSKPKASIVTICRRAGLSQFNES